MDIEWKPRKWEARTANAVAVIEDFASGGYFYCAIRIGVVDVISKGVADTMDEATEKCAGALLFAEVKT